MVGGALQGSEVDATDCLQRQRMLADQELENGGVAVAACSEVKGRLAPTIGDGQQAPLPRVELGHSDHKLNECKWRIEPTGEHPTFRWVFSQ